jgi:hypothetical protein
MKLILKIWRQEGPRAPGRLVEYPVEGFVRIASLEDDYYELDEETGVWRGRSSGRTFALGDPALVMIERIDVMAGQMDLALLRRRGKGAAKDGQAAGQGSAKGITKGSAKGRANGKRTHATSPVNTPRGRSAGRRRR